MSDQQYEEMTRIANSIAIGGMGIDLIHCIEEDRFYFYRENFWRSIFEVELLKMISEHNEYSYIVKHSLAQRKQIIENLKVMKQLRLEKFNNKGYLNFDFGEFDPMHPLPFTDRGGVWHDHDKKNYSTLRMPYKYCPGECKLWIKTLDEIFEFDKEKISTLQEFFGYCLTKDTRKEKALLLIGESRTGKSTILHVLNYMIGQSNCSNVALKYISDPQYAPMLMNKLVNIDTDVSERANTYEAEFKTITSGEPIAVNQKYVPAFSFRPYCKLVMAANQFPIIKDHSSAFYKRLIPIPCNRIFEDIEQNIKLKDALLTELYPIFEWACEGLERLNERGYFEQKDFILDAVAELREESNTDEAFLRDHLNCQLSDEADNMIEKKLLYEKYKEWCERNGHYCMSIIKFNKAVYRKYSKFTPKDYQYSGDGKRYWKNIKYVETKEEYLKETFPEEINWHD